MEYTAISLHCDYVFILRIKYADVIAMFLMGYSYYCERWISR